MDYLLRAETPAEFHLVRCAREMRMADFGDIAPQRAREKTIRARFLQDLIASRLKDVSVAPIGIAITGAEIEGDFSCVGFASATAPLPGLSLLGCRILGSVDFSDSCWTSIELDSCRLANLRAPRLHVERDFHVNDLIIEKSGSVEIDLDDVFVGANVHLRHLGRAAIDEPSTHHGFRLTMSQARIGGSIVLPGAYLENPDGDALSLHGAEVGRDLYLVPSDQHRFQSRGNVQLVAAKVGGSLYLSATMLEASTGNALTLDRAEVSGGVFLREAGENRFESKGGVSLSGAKVGGQFSCTGALIDNQRDIALMFDGADVKGDVSLRASERHRFEAKGEVRLLGARIGGHFALSGAHLENVESDALSMDGASVTGDLYFTVSTEHRFEAKGEIRLPAVKVGGQLSFGGAHLENPTGSALVLDHAEIGGNLILGASENDLFEAKGAVRLLDAKIGGQVACHGAQFDNPGKSALSLDRAEVAGSVLLANWGEQRFVAKGEVRLVAAKIANQFMCNGIIEQPQQRALSLDRAEVLGGIFLRASGKDRFVCKGEVRFAGAKVGSQVACDGALLENDDGNALLMEGARVVGDVFLVGSDQHRFEARGAIRLTGASIGGQLACHGASVVNPNGEAIVLDGVEIAGDVLLADVGKSRLEANGAVQIRDAKIGGVLSMTGALLKNSEGESLTMDRAEVAGSVFLRSSNDHRFESMGEIRLLGTTIGGQLSVSGALLANPKGKALSMDGADIASGIFLAATEKYPFEARGEVRMPGVKVGGQLSCRGTQFENEDGDAFSISGAEVRGEAFLVGSGEYQFKAQGSVQLVGSKIDGSLLCIGQFVTGLGSLSFEGVSVRDRLIVRLDEASSGEVSLRGATVGELDDNGGKGWGAEPSDSQPPRGIVVNLDGFTYARIGEWQAPPPPSDWFCQPLWLFRRLLGLGVEQNIWWSRAIWLERQYRGDRPQAHHFFPQPHEQLAKTLYAMGYSYDARRILNDKFIHESRCGADEPLSRFFTRLYRWCFGCGYLPNRALLTVLVWFAIGWIAVEVALIENDNRNVVLVKAAAGVELVRSLVDPDAVPKSPSFDSQRDSKEGRPEYAPHDKVEVRDVPCTDISPPLYALDTMLPVVDLHIEDKCEMASNASSWRLGKAIYAMIGWIIVAMAALTWTGVLRREIR